MKIVLIPSFCLLLLLHLSCCHVFYRDDIMSEDDVSYGLPTLRAKRDTWGTEGRIGPLYTHVKTDSGGTFKWGTKHMVGKMFAGTKSNSAEDEFDI